MGHGTQPGSSRIAPPGWHPDPHACHEIRYWNGSAWTEHVSDHGRASLDPVDEVVDAPLEMPRVMPTPVMAAAPQRIGHIPVSATTAPTLERRPTPAPAWSQSSAGRLAATGQRAAPSLPPPNPYVPPRAPGSVDQRVIGQPIGKLAPPWYRTVWFWTLVVLGVALAAAAVWYLARGGSERIDARPAAAAPAGFRVVTSADYTFAIPASWSSQLLASTMPPGLYAKNIEANVPNAGDALQRAARRADSTHSGSEMIAFDPSDGDNLTIAPYSALDGNPKDAGQLHRITRHFRAEQTGFTDVSIGAGPADVHGFPAATVVENAEYKGGPVAAVVTIVQTGDQAFEISVTSQSASRAVALSAEILGTFARR